jgi:hypothetical protein
MGNGIVGVDHVEVVVLHYLYNLRRDCDPIQLPLKDGVFEGLDLVKVDAVDGVMDEAKGHCRGDEMDLMSP